MNKAQPFRQHHVARALRAAAAAGMTNPTVEVHLPTGAKIVIGGRSGDNVAAAIERASKVRQATRKGR